MENVWISTTTENVHLTYRSNIDVIAIKIIMLVIKCYDYQFSRHKSPIFLEVIVAPKGKPLAIALAVVIISGSTPDH